MDPVRCQIIIPNPENRKFLPGDTVNGRVVLTAQKAIHAQFLKIGWKGEGRTQFKGDKEINRHTYFNGFTAPWAAKNNQDTFPAGKHTYPFTFVLPEECPPTYTAKRGSIVYFVHVELSCPYETDFEKTKEFFVAHRNCLAITAPEMIGTKKFVSEPPIEEYDDDRKISFEVFLKKQVYAPGDKIEVAVHAISDGSPFILLETELLRLTHFHRRPYKKECAHNKNINLCVMEEKDRKDNERCLVFAENMKIVEPFSKVHMETQIQLEEDFMPTFSSSMISLAYALQVTVRTSNFAEDQVTLRIPIGIGETGKPTLDDMTKGIARIDRELEDLAQNVRSPFLPPPVIRD